MSVLYGTNAKKQLDNNHPFWQDIADGEEVKVNHTTCPMGEDTRSRMNIINKGGAFLWHCFNCSDSGYYRSREYASMLVPATHSKVGAAMTDPQAFIAKCTKDVEKFSTEARLWLAQYEMLDQDILNAFDICYDVKSSSVVLPVWQETRVVGTQSRLFNSKIKYYTSASKPSAFITTIPFSTPEPLFIVEDLLSAYKLHWAGASVWCLLGTSIKGDVVKASGNVVLWLDSDIAGESAAIKLYKELSPLYPKLATKFDRQPKEVPFNELKQLVRELTV